MKKIAGILLILFALFYKQINIPDIVIPNNKLERPSEEIVLLVEGLPDIPDKVDSNKMAGIFNAISEDFPEEKVNTNIQLQYFLDNVGRSSAGDELKGKYPEFAPAAAKAITKVVGPQDETDPLSDEEKSNIKQLFYGFSWRLYDSSEDEVFESYKAKAKAAIEKHFPKEIDEPRPSPVVPDEECDCGGSGFITHADGHKTECPCEECGCKKPQEPSPSPTPRPTTTKSCATTTERRNFIRRLFRW